MTEYEPELRGDAPAGEHQTPPPSESTENHQDGDAKATEENLPKRVFVNNFPFQTTEDEIRAMFAEVGEIHSIRLLTTPQGRPRGIAFVQYKNQEDADNAIKKFNRHMFNGRPLVVEYTTQDPDGVDRYRRKLGYSKTYSRRDPPYHDRPRHDDPYYDRYRYERSDRHNYPPPPPYGGYRDDRYDDPYRRPPPPPSYDRGYPPRYPHDDRGYYDRDPPRRF